MAADGALDQKVIIVTGGAGLLGRRFCQAIADHGGLVIVTDRDGAAAELVAGEIVALGGRAEAAALDITDTKAIDDLIATLYGNYGRIDAVVNNAYPRNANYGRKVEDVTFVDFCNNVNLHLGGYFLVAQRLALFFRDHGGGNIVNMGSIYGTLPPRFEVYDGTGMTIPVEYAAIKAAIIQLTRYFARYFRRDRVRCNSLSPGGILAGQADSFLSEYQKHCGVKGMLHPGDVEGTLVFLLSDASSHMTGQNLIVDDGFSL